MEYKAGIHYTKAVEGRTVTGFASIIGNVDSGFDVVHKGAFRKTIKERGGRVKHLWMHDPYQPPAAVIRDLREAGADELPDTVKEQYPMAQGGLLVAREYLNTPRGDELLEGIQKGAITEMSFGYDPVKFDFEEIKEGDLKGALVRNLRELRLWDTSDVTWGMNAATVASKSDVKSHIQKLMEHGEFLIKAGRVLSSRNLQRLKDALAVLSEILDAAEPPEDEESEKALTERVLRRLQIAERELFLVQ
jgi:HK97 family phage prohead protease